MGLGGKTTGSGHEVPPGNDKTWHLQEFFLFTEFSVVVCVVQNQVEVWVRSPLGSVLEWFFLLHLFPYYTFVLFWYKNYVRLCGNVYRTEKNPHRIDKKWSNQLSFRSQIL